MKRLIAVSAIMLLTAASPSAGVYRDAGSGAFSFLKIDPGAEAAALGGTGLLNSSGSLAVFTNPALLVPAVQGQLSAGHDRWFGDATQSFLSWSFRAGAFSCALGTRFVHVGDLEMREGATSEPVTTFSAWDVSTHAAAAVRLGMFDIGLGAKVVREKIWTESASGFALDAGTVIHPADGLQLAFAVQHFGPSVTMLSTPYSLPATWRTGGRYTFFLPAGRVSLSAEVGKPRDNSPRAGGGAEWAPVKWLSLRTGMRFGDDTGDFTAGAGLSAGGWKLDYAFIPADFALGTVHRFTLHRAL